MEHYQLLKYAHLIPAVLLLAGVIAHAFMLWKAHRAGDAAVITRKLRVTRLYSLPALGVLALSLPVSGWWLVHLAGWPLSQLWLLAGSCLYLLGALSWVWLVVRLNRLRLGRVAKHPRFTLVLAIFCAVCFVAIAGLMGAKPV